MVNKTKDIVSGVGDTLSDGVQNVQDNVSDRRDDRKEGDDDDDDDDEEDPPTPCCMAATAECLACSAGVTVEEYCAGEGVPWGAMTAAPTTGGGGSSSLTALRTWWVP